MREPNTSNLKYATRYAFFAGWLASNSNLDENDPELIKAWKNFDPNENLSYRIIREHIGSLKDYR